MNKLNKFKDAINITESDNSTLYNTTLLLDK